MSELPSGAITVELLFVGELFRRTTEEFGRIDVVVANAGIWTGGAIDELDESAWQETIDVNGRSAER